MVNSNKLKAKMLENGFTQRTLANAIGLSANSLNLKINNKSNFDVYEAATICELLRIEDKAERSDIFLC